MKPGNSYQIFCVKIRLMLPSSSFRTGGGEGSASHGMARTPQHRRDSSRCRSASLCPRESLLRCFSIKAKRRILSEAMLGICKILKCVKNKLLGHVTMRSCFDVLSYTAKPQGSAGASLEPCSDRAGAGSPDRAGKYKRVGKYKHPCAGAVSRMQPPSC